MRKMILGSLVAATLGGASIPAMARTSVDFYVNIGPPPAYREYVPAVRPGFVWVPGFWDWHRGRHHWVAGHWVRARSGYYYAPTRWYERGGRYYLDRGGWRRGPRGDRDRDGIPNRFDRDRDGDGVPNRWDSRPNQARWR